MMSASGEDVGRLSAGDLGLGDLGSGDLDSGDLGSGWFGVSGGSSTGESWSRFGVAPVGSCGVGVVTSGQGFMFLSRRFQSSSAICRTSCPNSDSC